MVEHARELAGRSLGSPWPRSALSGPDGLEIGGVPASEMAARFGTPLLVYDEEEIRQRCRRLVRVVPRALYAVKAFASHAMVRIALDEGLDLLASTGGEVEACLRAGAPASRLVLHGNNKSDAELELAVRVGVSWVIVDHAGEVGRLDAIARAQGRVQPILLRVVPEVEVATHEAIATGHDASKFGTSLVAAPDVVRSFGWLQGVRFDGLHAHIGSQVLDAEPFLRAVDNLVDLGVRLRKEAAAISVLDIGGGFGVRYLEEDPLVPEEVVPAIAERLASRCAETGLATPALVVEPGRSLVANAGVTLYRVGARKQVGTARARVPRTLLAVDGGMADNVCPMLYDARHSVSVAAASVVDARTRSDGATSGRNELFTVVGHHCESGDTLAEDVDLAATTGPGDLLAFAATGAYTYSLASTYNQMGRPAVIGVRNGSVSLWLRREDPADLERLEAITPRATGTVEPPDGVTIRPAHPGDASSFLAFWSAVVAEGRYVRSERVAHPARVYRRRFRRPWTDHEAQIVAVDEHDRVIGHVSVQRERHPATQHVATLGIAVAAQARGSGVGSALLAEAFGWARAAGVEKVVLSVYPHNTAAIALYRKFGFVQEGRLAKQSRKVTGYEDEILMGAWIAGNEDRS
jgi:diaminopimelate decarboxylase